MKTLSKKEVLEILKTKEFSTELINQISKFPEEFSFVKMFDKFGEFGGFSYALSYGKLKFMFNGAYFMGIWVYSEFSGSALRVPREKIINFLATPNSLNITTLTGETILVQ